MSVIAVLLKVALGHKAAILKSKIKSRLTCHHHWIDVIEELFNLGKRTDTLRCRGCARNLFLYTYNLFFHNALSYQKRLKKRLL